MENQPEKKQPDPTAIKKKFKVLAFEAGTEFAFLIAAPLLAGIYAGKWLDGKTHHNFFVIIGLLLGLTVSAVCIYKRILDYKKML